MSFRYSSRKINPCFWNIKQSMFLKHQAIHDSGSSNPCYWIKAINVSGSTNPSFWINQSIFLDQAIHVYGWSNPCSWSNQYNKFSYQFDFVRFSGMNEIFFNLNFWRIFNFNMNLLFDGFSKPVIGCANVGSTVMSINVLKGQFCGLNLGWTIW